MTEQFIHVDQDGHKFYFKDKDMTIRHREDGPAVEYPNGTKFWYVNNDIHREDGPAVEYPQGTKCWYRNNEFHREDGPAIEFTNGAKEWWLNGKRHRTDGPAYEGPYLHKEWYINGVQLTKRQFEETMNVKKPSCEGKTVEVDGVKYKLVKA